jgi:TolB-like protein
MRNKALALAIAGLVLALWTPAQAGIEESLTKAQQLYGSAKFYEAIELLVGAIEKEKLEPPQAQQAYLLLAKCFYAKENENEAKTWLGKLRLGYPCLQIDAKKNHRHFMDLWYSAAQDSLCEHPDPGIQHIAVVDFLNRSIVEHDKWNPMQYGMADILITDLKKLTKLRVVDRERVQMIMDEIQVQQSEYFDDKTAVRVGKMLGVHVFVMGSFMQLEKGKLVITPKLVKTETGEILKSENIEGKPGDLMKMLAQAAEKVAGWLSVAVSEDEKKALHGTASESLQAALAYARGVNFEDEAKYAEAYGEYQKALAADPKYFLAQDRLEALAMYSKKPTNE